MNTCETCRFWSDEWLASPQTPLLEGWRYCALTNTDPDRPRHESKAYAADENWGAMLYCAPDYGCVQWQPGEPEA